MGRQVPDRTGLVLAGLPPPLTAPRPPTSNRLSSSCPSLLARSGGWHVGMQTRYTFIPSCHAGRTGRDVHRDGGHMGSQQSSRLGFGATPSQLTPRRRALRKLQGAPTAPSLARCGIRRPRWPPAPLPPLRPGRFLSHRGPEWRRLARVPAH